MDRDLPGSVISLARIIGVDRALRIAGLEKRAVYVPTRVRPGHWLVELIGEPATKALVRNCGGLYLYVGKCRDLRKRWRDDQIEAWGREGVPTIEIARRLGLTARAVRYVLAERKSRPVESMTASGTLAAGGHPT